MYVCMFVCVYSMDPVRPEPVHTTAPITYTESKSDLPSEARLTNLATNRAKPDSPCRMKPDPAASTCRPF